ncbi:hypothetical protein MNVI_13440 [Mycobacterium noviomagense]|uniref:Uncharacterized protein n=1 Tax=Mycobacterium noviomagense TaxID=459858 RepID=A0A7I7PBW9_9MYCO|nr:DUF3053 domain-containing protein [Mycobacterium noviomagense]BBY06026.1 hypothetical protein MNVI_13440 [Mycobacterium noviomagense]
MGYHQAAKSKPSSTEAERKAFGNLYADKYAVEGLTPAEAWKVYAAEEK